MSYSSYYDQKSQNEDTIVVITDIMERKLIDQKPVKEKRQAQQFQSVLIGWQLNPHFIFNTLNSIQYYILNQEVVPALDYVSDFSRLMRVVLENSLKEHISLSDEMNFLKVHESRIEAF